MLSDQIITLILEEQTRQNGLFIQCDIDMYLQKLGSRAEIVSDSIDGRCRGFIAYYCNDIESKKAFITLVLVDPKDRGLGLGQALTTFVLNIAKHRGFTSCLLEVNKNNQTAYKIYIAQGFHLVEERGEMLLLEVDL